MKLRLSIRSKGMCLNKIRAGLIVRRAVAAAVVVAGLAWAFCPRPPLLDNVPFSTAWYDRDGHLLRLSLADDGAFRLYTPIDKISPDLVTATLAQEDRYFYYHQGINPVSIVRAAFDTYIQRSRDIGASTITMQVVRMRDHLDTASLGGKIVQIFRALQLERHYTKREILEAYLNLAPYGGNIHGAEAASLIYFGRPADRLALPQSVMLAVIPQNPVKRSPVAANPEPMRQAALRLCQSLDDSCRQQSPYLEKILASKTRNDLPFLAPHLIDSLGRLSSGNDRIKTTLDLKMQTMLEKHISLWISREKNKGLDNASAMLLHVPTMEVRALAGSADFFNAKINGQVDGTSARRSPGSTLKPFAYALALDQGLIHPETLLADDPAYFAEYRPANFDNRFIGLIPARDALTLSRNVPAIALAARLHNPDLYEFLQQSGADFPAQKSHYGLSIVVGGAETDMRTLVRLYAMLANGGLLRDVKYTDGQKLHNPQRVLSPEAALLTLTMLDHPDPQRLPFALSSHSALPVYWKTGTSNGFRDAWTIGVFGPYVLAVWTGHFDGHASPALIGVEAAAPLFFDLAGAVMRHEPLRDQVRPALDNLNVARISICESTGAPRACGLDRKGWFIPGKSPFAIPQSRSKHSLEILSPRAGVAYVASRTSPETLRIPLETLRREKSGNQAGRAYWFDGNKLIATVERGQASPVFWSPATGHHTIRYVDDEGQSASQTVTVIAAE